MRFYEREGYREIPLFGAYVGSDHSVCYERVLPDESPRRSPQRGPDLDPQQRPPYENSQSVVS
jgi:hypothetical protein